MHARDCDFFDLDMPAGEQHGRMSLVPRSINPTGVLYGGTAAGAAITAMEGLTGRDLVWITVQYVGSAALGETIDVTAEVLAGGYQVSQVRVRGAVGEREVFAALGAVGTFGEDVPRRQDVVMPIVPGPEDCPVWTDPDYEKVKHEQENMLAWREVRRPVGEGLAHEAENQCLVWVRVLGHEETSAATLGWHADAALLPTLKTRMASPPRATSLDNTLRIASRRSTDWVLLDVRDIANLGGYHYGTTHLWDRDGELLGTASQTMRMRG
jgi:acyl-CoA thioesterase-2